MISAILLKSRLVVDPLLWQILLGVELNHGNKNIRISYLIRRNKKNILLLLTDEKNNLIGNY